jgi:putative flippase GtrA
MEGSESWLRTFGKRTSVLAMVVGFALVAGVGLALDFAIFLVLIVSGLGPGFANLISATTAVTFVYFVSTKQVFDYQGHFLYHLLVAYLVFQALAVAIASWAVAWLTEWGVNPAIAKLLILPATFSTNYLFLRWLTASRG